MRFLGAKLAKSTRVLRPRPRLEQQLTALCIPHSWIRRRVCVIISKEIEFARLMDRRTFRSCMQRGENLPTVCLMHDLVCLSASALITSRTCRVPFGRIDCVAYRRVNCQTFGMLWPWPVLNHVQTADLAGDNSQRCDVDIIRSRASWYILPSCEPTSDVEKRATDVYLNMIANWALER